MQDILKNLPNSPGVYRFIDKNNEIIYIGKAKNLKKRVKSYFNPKVKQSRKNQVMIKKIVDIKYSVVSSDLESYLLETNLIKEHKPRYNILMKDDKNFAYLRITSNQDYPKLFLERKITDKKSKYIGPKTTTQSFKKAFEILNKIFFKYDCQIGYETIKQGKISNNQKIKPICVIKQLDKSHTPCICDLNKEDYRKMIQIIIDFFNGKNLQIKKILEEQMFEYAKNKNFELAANYRDKMLTLEKIIERQKIISTKTNENLDILNFYSISEEFYFSILQIREGKIVEIKNILVTNNLEEEDSKILEQFLIQYYTQTSDYPKYIITPIEVAKNFILNFNEICKSNIKFETAKIGDKAKLTDLALKNAKVYAQKNSIKWMQKEKGNVLEEMKKLLNINKIPRRIECFDISHLSGTHTKASMVVFENAMPIKNDYRYFNIKTLEKGQIDDFKSLYEALKRRLKYISQLKKDHKLIKNKNIVKLKKNKEFLAEFEFVELEKYIELKNIKNSEKYILDSITLKKACEKYKKFQKIYLNQDINISKQILDETGFKEIKNSDYKYALNLKYKNDESFYKKPDLIIIDGGKGQLSSSQKALKECNLNIDMISIAKKFETIHLTNKEKFNLQSNDQILKLIQQLRDEAHRFAITQNRKARLKEIK
ncbi:excinuclease ABC subunit C [bacterium]|jgi:excinuclease ABC subunit C|nr:excinuclease ABC subunit C [bacterium]MBT6293892.1 excinuclease ABC subunit C [bacterium]